MLVHCCLVLCGQSFDAHFDIAAAVFCGLVFSKVLFHCLGWSHSLISTFFFGKLNLKSECYKLKHWVGLPALLYHPAKMIENMYVKPNFLPAVSIIILLFSHISALKLGSYKTINNG